VQHFTYPEESIPLPREVRQLTCSRTAWFECLVQRISDLQKEAPSETSHIEASLLFSILLFSLLRESADTGSSDDNSHRRILALQEELRHAPIPLPDAEALAARMGWSVSHFRACFRKVTGCSLGRYLQALHLSEARRLLGETQLPVKEIGSLAGYSDAVAFSCAFQQHTRQTPGRYRKETRGIA